MKVKKSKYFNVGYEQICPNFASDESIVKFITAFYFSVALEKYNYNHSSNKLIFFTLRTVSHSQQDNALGWFLVQLNEDKESAVQ